MVTKELSYFDLGQICDSGQCFRMERLDEDTCRVIAADRYLEVTQRGTECMFRCEEEEFENFWSSYFDLDRDYGACIGSIDPRDRYLTRAAGAGSGIRILRQDLWEMIVSFLISQQNNIVRIRRCIQNISEAYGREMKSSEGGTYYAFPTVQALAALEDDDLKRCNLGYRSKYVVRTARSIASGEVSLDAVRDMSYLEAREELLKLYGVGVKVADCICLFALHHLEAFPVDTHIRQVLEVHYRKGFPKQRYSGYEGILQQYIFYYDLLGKSRTEAM